MIARVPSVLGRVWPLLFILAVFGAILAQIWTDARPGILDSSVVYTSARVHTWRSLTRLFDVLGFGNQARPLQFLSIVPAFFSVNVQYYFWYQSGLVLLVAAWCMFKILRWCGVQTWISVSVTLVGLMTPSFCGNYYAMTAEPYMLFGVMGLVYVWVRLLGAEEVGKGAWWWYNGLGVIFAAYAIGVKEVGVMAFVVCMIAAGLIAWNSRIGVDEVIAWAWPALAAATLAFSAVVVKFLLIERAYDAGGSGGYALSAVVLARSLERFGTYLIDSAPYAWLGLPVWVWLAWYARWGRMASEARRALRKALVGALVFYVIALGMIAVYVPWQVFDARYLLIADSGLVLAVWLVMHGLCVVARELRSVVGRGAAWCGAVVLGGLTVVHALYTLAVGPLSEGIARHRFAVAYDEMFKYVTSATGQGGTVYFLMDWRFPEARENTVHSLDVFYGRGDIRAQFPTNVVEMVEPGLVVVSECELSMNYTRMPVHYEARKLFYRDMQPRLHLREVTNMVWETPVWYAKEGYNVPQYDSVWGLPALWRLKSGVYRFGWHIYWYEGGAGGAGRRVRRAEARLQATRGTASVARERHCKSAACWPLQAQRSCASVAQERHCKSAACWPLQAPCGRVRRAGARLQVRPLRGLQASLARGVRAAKRHCKSAPRNGAASGAGRRVRGARAPLQVRGLLAAASALRARAPRWGAAASAAELRVGPLRGLQASLTRGVRGAGAPLQVCAVERRCKRPAGVFAARSAA